MIQLKSNLIVTDKSSIVAVQCIKVLKSYKRPIALLGDVIIICVHSVNIKKYVRLKPRFQKKFGIGTMHRALVVRTKCNYARIKEVFIKFNVNHVILVTKTIVPSTNKVYGPLLKEFCIK